MTGKKAARVVRVTGLVQGVGFRPTVYRIALELGLSGYVFNDAAGVGVHLEGEPGALDAFPDALLAQKPPLARIDSIAASDAPGESCTGFSITESRSGGHVTTAITADAGTCRACMADLLDPKNRRYRYAFTNCTHCGPRFTITRHLPYDRPQTSMAAFPMCPECLVEYRDPLDRRFHAQPNACPVCGPALSLVTPEGAPIPGDPVRETVRLLRAGKTVAIKGLGGFHLACDARNPEAVGRLRTRKRRDEKPLAVMGANLASLERFVELSEAEKTLLTSPARPIVLARRRHGVELPGIAPGLNEIGVMVPYTPLHVLLFHTLMGEPAGVERFEAEPCPELLVMTSANPGGEPLVIENAEALRRLAPMTDAVLIHNRDILIRCDDSVARVIGGETLYVRRSRGRTPEAVKLAATSADELPVLAFGPYLKSTAAVLRGSEGFLTQHVGDLENLVTERALKDAVDHLLDILDAGPRILACDLHPDFYSTRLAESWAEEKGLPLFAVPHHAAHIGAVMAEAGRTGRTLGLAMDGVGLGPDREVWGGELLAVGPNGMERLGRLRPLPVPGGDRAAREPWRMGASLLVEIGREDLVGRFFASCRGHESIAQLARNERLSPRSSALGRLFDGVAALLGFALVQHDEATAAMRLEAAADRAQAHGAKLHVEDLWHVTETHELDLRSLVARLVQKRLEGENPEALALLFQKTLVRALADWTAKCTEGDPDRNFIALSGGCFLNRTLAGDLPALLREAGMEARLPRDVPPGDGGVSLGQAWLARVAFAAGRRDFPFLADRTRSM